MDSSYWENYYKDTPLDQIPWQRTQADYFKHLVDDKKITGETAIDLGCGTGSKGIYLAKNGFTVTGIDLSPSAIKYAKSNAEAADLNVNFVVANILDLDQVTDERFDFILDWAALHCIDRKYHQKYLSQIIDHSHSGTTYLLRVFSRKNDGEDHFMASINGLKSKVEIIRKEEVLKLFKEHFDILETKVSKPNRHDDLIFIEFLMRRK